jgi:hypothetical protein
MKNIPKSLTLCVFILLILIIIMQYGCRGGRSLGKGSVGTVIVPQTPEQINERNNQPQPKIDLPPLELPPLELTPISVANPKLTPVAPVKAARSAPFLESKSVDANPVIVNPKAAGEQKPFAPTHSNRNAPPAKLVNVIKLPPDDNGKGTTGKPYGWRCGTEDPEIAGPCEAAPEERAFINWVQLFWYWLFIIFASIFGWIAYDILQGFIKEKKLQKKENANAKEAKKKLIKKPAKATRESRKKALSKKNEKSKS